MALKTALFLASVLFVATVYAASAKEVQDDHDIHVVKKASNPVVQPKSLGSQECVQHCETLCKVYRKKRVCVHPCTTCCNKLQCLPLNGWKCENWTTVTTKKGEAVKCPNPKP